ncbi:MAG: hypothetical protein JJE48_03315 [Actinobacteria bacterium]|nr:hypothetical protein [Actinomycetota bacterium]
MAKRKVEIFIGPIACSCAGGQSPARQEKIARAFALEHTLKGMPDRFDVSTWRLGDDEDYEEGLAALRRYLRDAGEKDLADRLAFAVNDMTPAVALDGKLIRVRDCPTVDEITLNAEVSVTDSQEVRKWK